MVLGAGDRVGQTVQAELGEPGQKLLEMLAPEVPEHELGGIGFAPARDQGEHEARHEPLIEHRQGAMRGRLGGDAHRVGRRSWARIGSPVTVRPRGRTASATALAMAAGAPMVPPSPMPL